MAHIKDVTIGSNTYLIEPVLYAVTGGTTTAFTASISNFELVTGAVITLKMNATNDANATLNITSTGAKNIKYKNANITANALSANRFYSFIYDGSAWQLIGELDTNTGVKGNSEESYRTGQVNLTAANIGAVALTGDTMTGNLTLQKFLHPTITGTGTAAVAYDADTSTNGKPALWKFNLSTPIPTEGDIITITVPVAGHGNGVFVSTDNGTTYKPVSVSGTSRLTTHFGKGTTITLVYDSDGATNTVYPVAGAAATTNITGGCWRVLNYYDSNTTYSAMSSTEAWTGTATTSRTMRADYLKQILANLGGTNLTLTHNATNGIVLNHDSSGVTATNSVGFYKVKYDAQGHITGTAAVGKNDITNLLELTPTANTGTVTSITPGNGLISGTSGSAQTEITTSGTISIGEGKVTNTMLAGSIANGKLANSSIKIGNKTISLGETATLADIGVSYPVISVAGNTGAITADTLRTSLGLSNAMHFLGVTTTNISSGTPNTTATVAISGSNVTAAAGDVVLYGSQEYVWGNSKWNLLGDESSYKVKQTAKSDPEASDTTSTTFIDTISQDANGVITATKKTLPTYTDTKNTAGSTDSTSKLFLIGATTQDTNPTTNSNTNVFMTDGILSVKAIGVNYGTNTNKVTMQWNDTDQSLDFIFT